MAGSTSNFGIAYPSGSDAADTLDDTLSAGAATIDTALAGMVTKATYDANTILAATTDNTPAALTVGASTLVGRKSSGGIAALSVAEARLLLSPTSAAIATAGTSHTFDLNGDTEMDGAVTLDQTTCALTFTGWTANKPCVINLSIVGHAGRTFTFSDSTIVWAGGYRPVASTTGVTNFMVFSRDGGTTVYGFHDQKVNRYVWGPGHASTAVSSVSSPDFVVFNDARIVGGLLKLKTVGTGQTTIVDVNIDGTTAYSTQANRPTCAISTASSGSITLPDTVLITPGQFINFDIDQFGTSAAGLSMCLLVLEAA